MMLWVWGWGLMLADHWISTVAQELIVKYHALGMDGHAICSEEEEKSNTVADSFDPNGTGAHLQV